MDEELDRKFRIYEQQIMQIQEQLQAVEQAILDMNRITLGLDEIPKNKDSEILAPIGRGIFVNAKVVSEELTVDVGEGTFVKKTIPETKGIISEQVGKLNEMKQDLENELKKINKEITKAMEEAQEAQVSENNTNHSHDEEKCEEDEGCNCGHKH